MTWNIACTQRKFFIESVFETKISIVSEEEEILIASCNFTGLYLRRNKSILFLETEKVILGTSTKSIQNIEFSLFLPKDIPPSYCGNNIGIVYNLNVYVQGMQTTFNRSFICSVVSGVPACFESSAKIFIPAQYESIAEEREKPVILLEDCPRNKHAHELIVDLLRKGFKEGCMPDFLTQRTKVEESEELPEICAEARKYWIAEKENTHHPLKLYAKIMKQCYEKCERQVFYSITTQGKEYAKVLITITEEDPPHCLLNLSLELIEPIKNVGVSLVQVETVDDAESKERLYNTTKYVEYAKKVYFEIPLDRARCPTIITPSFSTQVEMVIVIDRLQEVRIKIK
ncbi:hypothetical protein NEAUS06_2204 [Nematocida ausubeli]|nr:hypothetical protein NEAUS06_2204 [Nematocida ausubeli]